MSISPFYKTAEELAGYGFQNIPKEYQTNTHLIYSSPATLAFNSPGAEGFGVKRAGLSIPDSVMLLVSPGCCGRNTTGLGNVEEYQGRVFYLEMEENDLVTGKHLKKIPQAVKEIIEVCKKRPSVVMICITCVDALLGTDMERVCHKAEETAGIPVRPCYMYALTREGRKPPMVHVRQSLYSLLSPMKKRGTSVNILGYFAPLLSECELYDLLRSVGVKNIRELGTCKDYEEYKKMAEANFNLVLNAEARFAALDIEKRLQIPFIELKRLYQIDKIASQYAALGAAIGVNFEDGDYRNAAEQAVERVKEEYPEAAFAVGEFMNGDPFELSLALVKYGFTVTSVYGTPNAENFSFIEALAKVSPKTKIYSNLEPSMTFYQPEEPIDFVIGKDAAYYHPKVPAVLWQSDIQPFGYAGVRALFEQLLAVGKEER